MPKPNWNNFEQLTGSKQYNFEILCRSLIRKHYGQFGTFIARANQPGVEFHLKLSQKCSLGDINRWFGWQCRWYDLPSGRSLGSARRNKIEKSIRTTEKEIPDMTDWVLWTKITLTKSDQNWFYGLKTKMNLHLWDSSEVESHLTGEAEIFRSTYFGELILSPNDLLKLHSISVARIRKRWLPEVHQIVDAERKLRRMLGEIKSWKHLKSLSEYIQSAVLAIGNEIPKSEVDLKDSISEVISFGKHISTALLEYFESLKQGDLDLLKQVINTKPKQLDKKLLTLPNIYRSINHKNSIIITNLLAAIRQSFDQFKSIDKLLNTRVFGVLADAGGGKTQLAAQISFKTDNRPAGILLFGHQLNAGNDINSLATRIVVPGSGIPFPSIESLLEALNTAGQRARCRLPLVIDGLNEAEDPRIWKGQIASLDEQMKQYPFVLVICTIRTGSRISSEQYFYNDPENNALRNAFRKEALPDDIEVLEIPNFGEDTIEAIRRYFHHYKINYEDAELPIEMLSHPLTLRIFCEVTNPKREEEVGIEAMPGSLTGLFEEYLHLTAERIAELAPISHKYYEQDIRRVYDQYGDSLWSSNDRMIKEDFFRKQIGDDSKPWNESIIHALEQEGIILRTSRHGADSLQIIPIYDALGGYLIANSIINKHGRDGFIKWIKEPNTIIEIENHPLAQDIILSFVGLVPRKLQGQQFWTFLEEPLRGIAIHQTTELEGSYLDYKTVDEISKLVAKPSKHGGEVLGRLLQTRGASNHPLNSKYLETLLKPMSIIERDLRWTEWIRRNKDILLTDINKLEERWADGDIKENDKLRAIWLKWTLTSTVRILRDRATNALYLYGCKQPDSLFELTIDSLNINDLYIPERMLAASYGVAMSLHSNSNNQDFRNTILPDFAKSIFDLMFKEQSPYSTTHALMRDYARHIILIARLYKPKLLKPIELKRVIPPFKDGGIRNWGSHKGYEFNEPLRMDFANYTLGRLVPGRRNYDSENIEYKKVLSNMFWRIDQLGYSPEYFKDIDRVISSDRWGGRSEGNVSRIDRYGKKYSWIAYFELYGFRYDEGLLEGGYFSNEERPSDIDIDPSFPGKVNDIQISTKDWLGNRKLSLSSWIEKGERPNLKDHLSINQLKNIKGPWVLLDGYYAQEDKKIKRGLFIFCRGLLISQKEMKELHYYADRRKINLSDLPSIPEDHYTFAGEIPWCETFNKNGFSDFEIQSEKRNKKISQQKLRFYRSGKKLSDQEEKIIITKLKPLLEKKTNQKALLELLNSEKITYRFVKDFIKKDEIFNKILSVLVPVRENIWENYHSGVNPGRNVVIPSREIAEKLKLYLSLPNWDMYDKKNNTASISTEWGNLWETGEKLCYLRKDLLDDFLDKEKLSLIWISWGEREIRMEVEEQQSKINSIEKWSKKFAHIYFYNKKGKLSYRMLE